MTNQDKNGAVTKSALRRQREREQRYESILRAAQTRFSRDGYHATSMESIAEIAEVSVGTVYFYFKNKEDLLVHLLDRIGYRIRELVGAEFRGAEASLDGFRAAGLAFFLKFCTEHPEQIAIFFRESVGQSKVVEEKRRQIFEKFTGDIKNALLNVSSNLGIRFRSVYSVEVMAVSIVGMYERVAYQYLIWQDNSEDLPAIAEDAMAFIVGGLQNLCENEGAVDPPEGST
ncbi:MAG: TetR/AcrR family transcriptional regulator [Desulfatibacillaceae bacterium]